MILILRFNSSFLAMPLQQMLKSDSSKHKLTLLNSLHNIATVMHPCKNCALSNTACQVGDESDKCVICICSSHPCDLAISPATLKRLNDERLHLHQRVCEACAKVSRLEKQLELVEDKVEQLAEAEWHNILELEKEEV